MMQSLDLSRHSVKTASETTVTRGIAMSDYKEYSDNLDRAHSLVPGVKTLGGDLSFKPYVKYEVFDPSSPTRAYLLIILAKDTETHTFTSITFEWVDVSVFNVSTAGIRDTFAHSRRAISVSTPDKNFYRYIALKSLSGEGVISETDINLI